MNQTSIPFTSSLRVRKGHDVEEDQDDDDEDNLPLDEQEQEELIEKLKVQDESRNAFFILAFTCLSLFPTIFHLVRLLHGNFGFLDLLSLSSLLITTYTLRYIPPNTQNLRPGELSPAQQYLPYLNPLLIVVITLKAWTSRRSRYDYDKDFWFLPLVVWGIVTAGKRTMAGVNVGDLDRLRYKYKGA